MLAEGLTGGAAALMFRGLRVICNSVLYCFEDRRHEGQKLAKIREESRQELCCCASQRSRLRDQQAQPSF